MNPTLYDVLGVSRDASRDEIRTAWRDAADRFEPGSGGSSAQFRLFNEAAEVLLDPERRKAYDATLSDEVAADDSRDAEPAGVVPGPPMPGTAHAVAPAASATSGTASHPTQASRPETTEPTGTTSSGGDRTADPAQLAETGEPAAARRGLPRWVLVGLAVLTAIAVGVAAYAVTEARDAAAYQEAVARAPAAAESAAAAILSYDHESLEADRDAAAKFLTDDYRGDYVDTFDNLIAENATKTQARVEAEVLASSAMQGGGDRDPGRVPVLLFVNQTTTRGAGSGEPSVALNRVRLDMVEVDGTWLVDGITSY